jgi:beta-glucosidase
MEYPVYAEGFYDTLKRVGKTFPNLPIYVTENGVADDDDSRRKLFIKRYLYAMSKAISEGVNVRGYYYWTLMDNFEWAFGYDMRFGLYEVDYDAKTLAKTEGAGKGTLNRRLRSGAEYYRDVMKRFAKKQR